MGKTKFTHAEIKSAKFVRDSILKDDSEELKSIYMAGEIVMWDEINSNQPKEEDVEKLADEYALKNCGEPMKGYDIFNNQIDLKQAFIAGSKIVLNGGGKINTPTDH